MVIYALTILVSAFLLFQVQPVIAKIILPWFGGSAAVWTTCMLFFQTVLVLGYLYSHTVIRHLRPRVQAVVHIGLLLLSLAALPILPKPEWKPAGGGDPIWGILGLLALTVGLPYFLLSTTGPLLQAWYARSHKGAVPYRLFAISNAGSMFALISYPFLFEPVFTTRQQATMWSIAYGCFIALCAFTAWRSTTSFILETPQEVERAERPPASQYLTWMGLAACASTLLLAVTNHMSQNIAAIPFLWVLPLSVYLLTFILCFEGSGWYRRNPYLQLLAVALGSMAYAMGGDLEGNVSIKILVVLFSLGLFTSCMVCHGELAAMKPHPRYLTQFYLMVSVGGAMGGLLVGLVAPHVFNGFYELPLGLVATAFMVIVALKQDAQARWFRHWRQPAPLVAAALAIALAVYLGMQLRETDRGARLMVRNFYGGLRVKDSGAQTTQGTIRTLIHGTINHGEEYLSLAKRDLPITYYGGDTGVALAVHDRQSKGPIRLGVIGLGTGTMAAFGRAGDYVRFYEINPLVPIITRTQFYYVPDSKAKVDIAMGDARLSLEREQPENFDVLVVDAFSSDAIPVHLLTREAMQLYFRHLKPDGFLAVHISNRYLDLKPVLAGEAAVTGKIGRIIETEDDDTQDLFGTTWVLIRSPQSPFSPAIQGHSSDIATARKIRLWTDDYSNLFQILK
ncbi:MAG: fused MFS/spermidine synthase [Acidobacteriia bacterium]|nr:fused MFS/spermidine synthase [Terriglobia bacterium]